MSHVTRCRESNKKSQSYMNKIVTNEKYKGSRCSVEIITAHNVNDINHSARVSFNKKILLYVVLVPFVSRPCFILCTIVNTEYASVDWSIIDISDLKFVFMIM